MSTAPNTGSSQGVSGSNVNKTSTSISPNIVVTVAGSNSVVGAIQSLQITESRNIKMIDEVGTDGHVNSVPNQSTTIKGSCSRVRYDRLRIAEAFSRGFVHVASQVYPFDIVILDKQKRNVGSQISTVIKSVWINSIEYTYNVSDWVIMDNMQWEAETIFSVLNNGSGSPVAVGGERGVQHMGAGPNGIVNITSGNGIVNIEQMVDSGQNGYRGSLTASGLIDIGSGGVPLF